MRISDWSSDVCSSDLGARARELPFTRSDGDRIWTYPHALMPPEMPTDLLVIGSGAIGCEFASFFTDLGAKVTIVEMLDRILPVEDEEVSAFVAKDFARQGMTILTGHRTTALDVKPRSEEHTSELQSLMRISYAVFC